MTPCHDVSIIYMRYYTTIKKQDKQIELTLHANRISL